MKHFFETRVTLVMVLSCLAGLAVPGLPDVPDRSIAVALAILMFLSCYSLRGGGFANISWQSVTIFYSARYLLLPPALWFLAHLFLPGYATAILLLSVLPAAVASPAFTRIFGGAAAAAFVVVVISQALAPLSIPLHFAFVGAGHDAPSPEHLLTTLVLCIFAPVAVYALVRNHASAEYFYRQQKFFSMLLVAFMIALAVAKVRHIIFADPAGIVAPLLISLACFFFYIPFGWILGGSREEKIAFAACSSFNNLGLGVSLALLHFPPEVILFTALGEISWSLLPAMMRVFLKAVLSR